MKHNIRHINGVPVSVLVENLTFIIRVVTAKVLDLQHSEQFLTEAFDFLITQINKSPTPIITVDITYLKAAILKVLMEKLQVDKEVGMTIVNYTISRSIKA